MDRAYGTHLSLIVFFAVCAAAAGPNLPVFFVAN
jgi:hypothetical protein